jgi:hypothetical protein
LQLVFFLLFYEDQNLDMPCHASEPMSKPVQPQASYFRPILQFARGHLRATRPYLRNASKTARSEGVVLPVSWIKASAS